MRLEVGKFYRTRDNNVVEATVDDRDVAWPIFAGGYWYARNGRWASHTDEPSPHDIIEEVPQP